MTTRTVKISMDAKSFGEPWFVRCSTCPMKPHTDALGQAAPICASGIMTNLQGAVPLKVCESYTLESIKKNGDAFTIECKQE